VGSLYPENQLIPFSRLDKSTDRAPFRQMDTGPYHVLRYAYASRSKNEQYESRRRASRVSKMQEPSTTSVPATVHYRIFMLLLVTGVYYYGRPM